MPPGPVSHLRVGLHLTLLIHVSRPLYKFHCYLVCTRFSPPKMKPLRSASPFHQLARSLPDHYPLSAGFLPWHCEGGMKDLDSFTPYGSYVPPGIVVLVRMTDVSVTCPETLRNDECQCEKRQILVDSDLADARLLYMILVLQT